MSYSVNKSNPPISCQISKATTDDVGYDDKGNIIYRGIKFPAFNKPIKSNREDKQGMVLAKKGNEIKVVHFGDPSMKDNYSVEANDAYYARHGEETDKFSAKFWSNEYLWPRGKLKGKGAKDFYSLKKETMEFNLENLVGVLQRFFGSEEKDTSKVEVLKSTEQRVSYEVIYEPDVKDAHGNWMKAENIIKACENFNKNLSLGVVQPNLFHMSNTELFSIEKTWVQEELDMVVEQTGEIVKAGTWVAKIRYHDKDLWELKKAGIIEGVSVYCLGEVDHETGEILSMYFDPIEED